mgnify:FL=1
MWHKTTGIVRYYEHYVVAYVDQGIVDFYRSLIPKSKYVTRQRYSAHVTIVREEKDFPPNKQSFWNKHEGETIQLEYNSVVRNSQAYYWLDVVSKDIEMIREELGLENRVYDLEPPVGYAKLFHITLGNTKNI